MRELRQEFAFAGYWLTPAPGEKTNSWAGKRSAMEGLGYGFLLLARGRAMGAVRTAASAKQKGIVDAQEAAGRAKAEGFDRGAIIFLDVEDGGRLPAAYHAYWVFNDACPPSPGCVPVQNPSLPSASGVKDATVWQFVRSPREKETAGKCSGFAVDENCYAAADSARRWHLDMNVARAANPSFAAGR